MFGYFGAPCRCAGAEAQAEYRRYFCGLCNVLAREYGNAARWLINRDATALAVLWAAQTEADPALTVATCCNPWGARRQLCQSGSGMAFAAAVTVVALQSYAADQRADERGPVRWGWAGVGEVGRPLFRRARRALDAVAFDSGAVMQTLAGQAQIERAIRAGQCDWRLAADATANAFSAIVAHQAWLAGNRSAQPAFADLGRRLGRAVYWLDARQDWTQDRRRGRFNPLPHSGAVDEALAAELTAAETILASLPLARHRALLAHILIEGPRQRLRRLLSSDDLPEQDAGVSGKRRLPRTPREGAGASPGQFEQGCAACGDGCTCCDGCCRSVACCNDCCQQEGSCGPCDGCCGDSCDCSCDCGGGS